MRDRLPGTSLVPMSNKTADGRRLGLVIGVVLAVAVGIAAIVTSLRPETQLDPDTPEGKVQAFFQAIEADDWDGLRGLLARPLQATCDAAELAEFRDDVDRAVITNVEEVGSETLVEVRASRVVVDDPLNPYSYEDTFRFLVGPVGDGVAITELPGQFYCGLQ